MCAVCALLLASSAFAAPVLEKPAFSNFLYATQYYRAPTPLAEEWERDIARLGESNLETLQIRINWRNNERQEDVYTFDDVDRLMDLAEKYDRTVIIKFLLECAPQYVFDKYNGTRVGPKGELFRGGSHGAYYTGGWMPCFTNPKVADRAAKFVRMVAARYASRKSVIAWNAWNEPRNRPVEECFCPACRKAFGEYLREKFGTIERLNAFYGVAEESFEAIALPAMPHGYWDIYEFKLFKSAACIRSNLKFVYDAVRTVDSMRPVVSHVGLTSGFQAVLGDCCDDWTVSRVVDGWGTSLPLCTKMDTRVKRLEYGRLNDFLKSIDPNYFIYEVYPGLGTFKDEYDDVWDMDYKLYAALANGATGVNFWQYRAERVGMENDCAGLVRMDGTPRPVLGSVREFAAAIKPLKDHIIGFHERPADVVIVFDYKSLLLSEIEDACTGGDYRFVAKSPARYYPHAHSGFYNLMRLSDIDVDYLNVNALADISKYRVAYLPHYAMLDPKAVPVLERYVREGGTIVADEGFGMRLENTWMNPYDIKAEPILKARLLERRFGARELANGLKTAGYHSDYRVEGAKTLLSFADGKPAAQVVTHGKGRFCLLGFSLGFSAQSGRGAGWKGVLDAVLDGVQIEPTAYGRWNEDLEERRLVNGDEQYLFLINASNQEKRVNIRETVRATYGSGRLDGATAVIPSRACLILLCNLP